MQIVIEIPDERYKWIKDHKGKTDFQTTELLYKRIGNGIPLPKGHGDLVDRDKINGRFYSIWKELESYSNQPSHKELLDKWSMCMDTAPTIIEADTESGVVFKTICNSCVVCHKETIDPDPFYICDACKEKLKADKGVKRNE